MNPPFRRYRFLNTRPKHQAASLSEIVVKNGGEVVELPTLEICAVEASLQRDFAEALRSLRTGDWVFFTSANGVREVCNYLEKENQEALKVLSQVGIAVVGEVTKEALFEFGIKASFCGKTATSKSLGEEFLAQLGQKRRGQKALLFQAKNASAELSALLEEGGFEVINSVVYYSICPEVSNDLREQVYRLVREKALDGIFSTSSEALRNLSTFFEGHLLEVIRNTPLFVIGSQTEATAMKLGFKEIYQSPHPKVNSLVETAFHYFSTQNQLLEGGGRV